MSAQSDLHLSGPVGLVTSGSASVTIEMPCSGPMRCPYMRGSPDAQDENQFFADTGIRAGTRARQLLKDLQARHPSLRWRGRGSVSSMWRHAAIVYLDGDDKIRITPSRFNELQGWLMFSMAFLFLSLFFGSLIWSGWKVNSGHLGDLVLMLSLAFFAAWVSIDNFISPERAARNLLRLEALKSTQEKLDCAAHGAIAQAPINILGETDGHAVQTNRL